MVLLGHDMMNHGWMSGQKLAGCIAVLSIRESMILPPHAITCISSIICTFWPHGPAMSLAGHVPKMHPPCKLPCIPTTVHCNATLPCLQRKATLISIWTFSTVCLSHLFQGVHFSSTHLI